MHTLIIDPSGTVACVSLSTSFTLKAHDSLGVVMIAENVSIGILSLPSAVATLGMGPYVPQPQYLNHH